MKNYIERERESKRELLQNLWNLSRDERDAIFVFFLSFAL